MKNALVAQPSTVFEVELGQAHMAAVVVHVFLELADCVQRRVVTEAQFADLKSAANANILCTYVRRYLK